ncbi:NCS1 family nucleobase:cation symporter-1 [bacterium]|nr:NCS1 family nucleobase:cation symporter-1 [bacterium]
MSKVREVGGLVELTEPLPPSPYANADISPTPISARSWNWWHIACLWVGLSVCIPTYMLAAGLIAAGMTWVQAVMAILLGNAIVLLPMALNAHPGTKYGVPFPVLIRSSFGLNGAHIPSLSRAFVACGWFGIQTWVGGKAIYELVKLVYPGISEWGPGLVSAIGINGGELASFLLFWAVHMWFVYAGTESIKWLETASAPILIFVGLCLLGWAWNAGGGLGSVLRQSEVFAKPALSAHVENGQVTANLLLLKGADGVVKASEMRVAASKEDLPNAEWQPVREQFPVTVPSEAAHVVVEIRSATGRTAVLTAVVESPASGAAASRSWLLTVFFPLLTAMVGYWATLSLNIPDLMRFAKSQKDQVIGQLLGLPTTMTFYAFVGIVSTCAAVLVFPDVLVPSQAPWDPVSLLSHFEHPVLLAVSLFSLIIATITTNLAANVVSPANSICNLAPASISYKMGGYITGVIGILMMPWKLLENVGAYIFTWLIGYSALMGGIAGVMIADYWILRGGKLNLPDLYREGGEYPRWRWKGILAFFLGVIPNVPGFLNAATTPGGRVANPGFFDGLYAYAWFVSFGISLVVYMILTMGEKSRPPAAA